LRASKSQEIQEIIDTNNLRFYKHKNLVVPCFICHWRVLREYQSTNSRSQDANKVLVTELKYAEDVKAESYYTTESKLLPYWDNDDTTKWSEQRMSAYRKSLLKRNYYQDDEQKLRLEEAYLACVLEQVRKQQVSVEHAIHMIEQKAKADSEQKQRLKEEEEEENEESDEEEENEEVIDDENNETPTRHPSVTNNPLLEAAPRDLSRLPKQTLRAGDEISLYNPIMVAGTPGSWTTCRIKNVRPMDGRKRNDCPLLVTASFMCVERNHQVCLRSRWLKGELVKNEHARMMQVCDYKLSQVNNGKFDDLNSKLVENLKALQENHAKTVKTAIEESLANEKNSVSSCDKPNKEEIDKPSPKKRRPVGLKEKPAPVRQQPRRLTRKQQELDDEWNK
jgi:hypothetical protein